MLPAAPADAAFRRVRAAVAGCAYCDGALEAVPARSASSPAHVHLPAAALAACGLSAGERVLVAVVRLPDDGGAVLNGAASPFSNGGASPASGAPTTPRLPPTGSRTASRPRLELGGEAVPLPFEPSGAARGADAVAAGSTPPATHASPSLPGELLLAACVWPSQKLGVDAVQATAAVLDAAGWPPAGSVLRLYPLACSCSSARVQALATDCVALTLTLCEATEAPLRAAPDDATPAKAPAAPATPLPSRPSRGSASASKAGTPGGESPARGPAAASKTRNAAARCARAELQHLSVRLH
jgi:hypothetical protein